MLYELKDSDNETLTLTKEYLELSKGLYKYDITEAGKTVRICFTDFMKRQYSFSYHVCFIESNTKCYGYVEEWKTNMPSNPLTYLDFITNQFNDFTIKDFYINDYIMGQLTQPYSPYDLETDIYLENSDYIIATLNNIKIVGNIGIISK